MKPLSELVPDAVWMCTWEEFELDIVSWSADPVWWREHTGDYMPEEFNWGIEWYGVVGGEVVKLPRLVWRAGSKGGYMYSKSLTEELRRALTKTAFAGWK